jgi:hypothetical protein
MQSTFGKVEREVTTGGDYLLLIKTDGRDSSIGGTGKLSPVLR